MTFSISDNKSKLKTGRKGNYIILLIYDLNNQVAFEFTFTKMITKIKIKIKTRITQYFVALFMTFFTLSITEYYT